MYTSGEESSDSSVCYETTDTDETDETGKTEGSYVIDIKQHSILELGGRLWGEPKKLGNGEYAEVYQFSQLSTDNDSSSKSDLPEKIAVKIARPKYQDQIEMDVLAGKLLSDQHKENNVIKYLGHKFDPPHIAYMGIELLRSKQSTIGKVLEEKGPFSVEETLRLGIQILRGIYDSHSVGLLHRDLKPENIGLLPEPNSNIPVIFDFGMARLFVDSDGKIVPPRSRLQDKRGSYDFMSFVAFQQRELGRVDDLWSWLYTMTEMIQGMYMLPYSVLAETSNDYADLVASKSPEFPAETTFDGCPEGFCQIAFHLTSLGYEDPPDYDFLFETMASMLEKLTGREKARA